MNSGRETGGPAKPGWSRRAALSFVLLFGAVNLFADMTYEGARSVNGPFLGMLGASGLIVGSVAGFGEFLGYALRLASGRLADRSRLYWPITIAGYVVQMVAVPALAFAGSWPAAAVLILAERVGRATRNPPRNVMLAEAGEETGRGWAFGLNEGLDQLGALLGPLAVAAILAAHGSYWAAFAALAIPAAITLLLVLAARLAWPDAGRLARGRQAPAGAGYPRAFWWYMASTALVGFGFADFALISFHFQQARTIPSAWVPVYYAFAMGAGGLGSLVLGKLFDARGLLVLVPVTIVVAAYAPLAFFGTAALAFLGMLIWGVGLGAHESVMEAAVAQMIPHERLGSAYGLFGAAFGVAWFVGSVAMGALYDVSVAAAVWLAVATQLLAVVPLVIATRLLSRSD
jgi:predicted MFS family arabinose efflux permease